MFKTATTTTKYWWEMKWEKKTSRRTKQKWKKNHIIFVSCMLFLSWTCSLWSSHHINTSYHCVCVCVCDTNKLKENRPKFIIKKSIEKTNLRWSHQRNGFFFVIFLLMLLFIVGCYITRFLLSERKYNISFIEGN